IKVFENLRNLNFAPSVPLQYVPPSIYDTDYEEEEEDPDIRMSQNEYSDSDDEIGRRNERCYHPNGNNPL
ncbi:17583_t:CDS:2, partial [Entrophospora sp. SA101]